MPGTLFIIGDYTSLTLCRELSQFCEESQISYENFDMYQHDNRDHVRSAVLMQQVVRKNDMGVLICSNGFGSSMEANRFSSLRAVTCSNPYDARIARNQLDANVLCLGSDYITPFNAKLMLYAFLETEYEYQDNPANIEAPHAETH